MIEFNKDNANKTYGKDKNDTIDSKKKYKNTSDDDIQEAVKHNKGKTSKVYEINVEKKRLLRERREKAIQNAKDRQIEKANTQATLQAHTMAHKALKTNQDIRMTDNAAEYKDDMDDIHLFQTPPIKPHTLVKLKCLQDIILYVQNLY